MIFVVASAVFGAIFTWLSYRETQALHCRCRPGDACWPPEATWTLLNDSVNGNLAQIKPIGHVCHDPTYDQSACEEVQRLAGDTGWRASQKGALQDWVWEIGLHENETCHIGTARDMPCHQGRIPFYSVTAESVHHIQRAVQFARQYNLRLVIRNTGHDMAGRSSGADALQIYTGQLRSIQFSNNFCARGVDQCSGPAFIVDAGVTMGELYARGSAEGYTVVGGDCPTVGVVGGFLQGGGVSNFFSHIRGLAVDNVLEMVVVDANGELVVANAAQNKDLFWALRGGGGGTYGVVVQATIRAFPDDPVSVSELSISSVPTSNNESRWTEGLTVLFQKLQSANQDGIGGQLVITSPSDDFLLGKLTLFALREANRTGAEGRMSPIRAELDGKGIPYKFSVQSVAKLTSTYRQVPDINVGNHGIVGGTVGVSHRLFNAPNGPTHLAKILAQVPLGRDDLLFTCNLGGEVMHAKHATNTAVHPNWRASGQLINYVQALQPTLGSRRAALDRLTRIYMPLLYSIDPGFQLSYLNVGDPSEGKWREVYWGSNYKRLLKVKRKWDPEDLFITTLGVGSEKWDREGMCRNRRSLVDHAYNWNGYF